MNLFCFHENTMTKDRYINEILPFVTKASRYLGNEINAVKKDLSGIECVFALAFPDAYEIGMSHMGLHILYGILNSISTIACERVFAPWPDMEAEMKKRGLFLSTLESNIPLKDCTIIGFSLEYELSYATVLRMLSLADIPLFSRDRDKSYPLIVAGGPCTFNPEPVADFFDAMVIGDGEEVVIEICKAVMDSSKRKKSKQSLLHALSEIKGVYIPSFFSCSYDDDGKLSAITPHVTHHERIKKRVVKSLSDAYYPAAPVVPYMQVVHDRAGVEISRGCSRGCRFCMAGMLYRPVREKSLERIRDIAAELLSRTGYEELSLSSLSAGDYSSISNLLKALLQDHACSKVALSFPSLRVASLTRDLIEDIKKIRKTGFTIAPEAGTQRLRDVINKGLTEKEILETASHIFDAGWSLVKLYFMLGLPTETDTDMKGITALCKKVASLPSSRRINISLSTFVPKSHTPFQWEEQVSSDAITAKQRYLAKELQGAKLRLKFHRHELSRLEGVFSRGDRKLSRVLLHALRLGGGFEAWTDFFSPALWDEAFRAVSIDPSWYLRRREYDELLPWSHIDSGIEKEFLLVECKKAYAGKITPDCRTSTCNKCGVCSSGITPEILSSHQPIETPCLPVPSSSGQTRPYRYRLVFSKTGSARFLSQLELSKAFSRSVSRARLPICYSSGFHPMPRIIFYSALPVGLAATSEYCDLLLSTPFETAQLPVLLNQHLPPGIYIHDAQEITLKNNPTTDRIEKYRIDFSPRMGLDYPTPDDLNRYVQAFLDKDSCTVRTAKKNSPEMIDVRNIVVSLSCIDHQAYLELSRTEGKIPRITEIIGHIFNLGEREQAAVCITKTA